MPVDIYKPNPNDALSLRELDLYKQIMAYRTSAGLDEIPLSRALTTTAGRHVVDTYHNFWVANRPYEEGANLHSWSDAAYYSNHSAAAIMWDAPERLGTGFTGNGYEISAAGYGDVTQALAGWKSSSGHNVVILNQGGWANLDWKSIGIGVLIGDPSQEYQGKVYHVWFSDTADSGVPDIVGSALGDAFGGTGFRDRLFGRAGADTIDGGNGADRIEGSKGRDVLTGGEGADGFVFALAPRQAGADQITDFQENDVLRLEREVFVRLGAGVNGYELRRGTEAGDRNDYLIYDQASGRLWYDADANGRGGKVLVAVLDGSYALSAADFEMI